MAHFLRSFCEVEMEILVSVTCVQKMAVFAFAYCIIHLFSCRYYSRTTHEHMSTMTWVNVVKGKMTAIDRYFSSS